VVTVGAQLAATVYVKDPDTHQTIRLDPGTLPEQRLATLVTNPAAWVDGKLPRQAKVQPSSKTPEGDAEGKGQGPAEAGQDGVSGHSSDADDQSTEPEPNPGDDAEDTKPTARKRAAKKTAPAAAAN
jgi:hypothetical protein